MTEDEAPPTAIDTATTTISIREDGMVVVRVKRGAELTLEAAQENHVATMKLVGERDFLILVDARSARGITREARVFFADPEVRKQTIAEAILIGSGLSTVLGNFFMRLSKPPHPTKLFTVEEAAAAWLQEQHR